MKNIVLLLVLMFLLPIASADTLNDAFNGSYTVTDASVSYDETVGLPEASPDWIEITITGDYPGYASGVPYLNLKAYYELDGDVEDSTTVHDGTHTGTTAGTYDGVDDVTTIPAHSDFNFSGDFTISAQVDVDDFQHRTAVIDGTSYAIKVGQDKIPYFEAIDDSTMTETSLGTPRGTSYFPNCLITYNGELYAALYSGYVYKYDGSSWSSCGQIDATYIVAYTLAIHNGKLYASGGGGVDYPVIYRYDGGTTWTSVGGYDYLYNDYVLAMTSHEGKLFAGTDNGNVFYYDGSSITNCGTVGTTTDVRAFTTYKGELYCSGSGNGVVYRWDGGSTWTSIGDIGATYHINSLVVYDDTIYASLSGSTLAGYVYKWDGIGTTTWSSCGRLGTSSELRQLCVYNGQLYGNSYSNGNLYRYDGGTTWTAEAMGTATRTYCLTTHDGKLMVGGYGTGVVYSVGTGEAIYGTALTADTDTYLTAVRSGSTITFYQDTTSKGTCTTSFALDTIEPVYIGRGHGSSQTYGGDEALDGEIHNVGFWSDDVDVASIINGEVGLFMLPSSDVAWVPYEGATQLISIGTILDGVTFRNTDGGPNGITIVERFLYAVETSNEVNTGGFYEVDVELVTTGTTSDGKITIPVEGRAFTSATVTGDSIEMTYATGYLYIDTDTLSAGTHDFHIVATYETGTGGNTYSPTASRITMIALSNTIQVFSVTTADEESHDFVWTVDDVEVQSDSGLSSSYTYESGVYGSDTIEVAIDETVVHVWTVVNGLDTDATTRSIQNLNNFNLTYKQIDEYPGISSLMSVDENNTSAMIEALFIPVTHYWMDDAIGIGSWIYVVIVILTVGITYIKTKRLETTSMVLLIMSLMVAAPATAGTIMIPAAVTYLMYICAILSIVGIFGGLLMGDNQ